MPVFPKVSLRPEVEDYLRESFVNAEIVTASSKQEAERKFETLLTHLSHPPSFTTVRVNTHLASVQHVKNLLLDELLKEEYKNAAMRSHCWGAVWQCGVTGGPCVCSRNCVSFKMGIGIRMTEPVYLSPSFDNVLPNYLFLQNLPSALVTHVLSPQPGEKILDMCAAPGGKTTHIAARMRDQGEVIALDKISHKVEKIKQNALLLGLKSIQAFCFDATKALAHGMVDTEEGFPGGPRKDNPSSCSSQPPSPVWNWNLQHALQILDSYILWLPSQLLLRVYRPCSLHLHREPPFLPASFDRILLDAPCSGMGQRPNLACTWTLKEVTSYQPLQRKLLTVAAQLLKPGGVLVYSTCTVTLAENEEQVAWALATFPHLQLQPQEPRVGGEGMVGAGLSPEQLQQLQRFDPSAALLQNVDTGALRGAQEEDMIALANKDCIGFFIAKFVRCKST
ncbi:tRNA (cytosine(72)-C(5))-methyltransferase NSUN6 isoform X4 [Tamandua tetradactyla]|uniref:tRNA (cytosine(72)-C(5))-methyltransferase NSUN6 isoform X4 n=1 Tax=Tamandua tetradactyla TaxID=48850 RepID=UPI0040548ABD